MELKIGGVAYRHSVPATVSRTLDESLDSAHVVIPYTDRKEPFTPFSFAELDGEMWLVGADMPAEVKGLRGKWKHDVTLVEETKRLETMFISAKTITKHEYRDHASNPVKSPFEYVSVNDPYNSGYNDDDIHPTDCGAYTFEIGSFTLKSAQEVRDRGEYTEKELSETRFAIQKYATKPYAAWVECEGEVLVSTDSVTEELSVTTPDGYIGRRIEAHYMLCHQYPYNGNPVVFYEIMYSMIPYILPERTTNKTAREIVEDLIADAEQLRHGDTPRIHLSADEAARLDLIEAPEDAFSEGMTLFEALLKVGDWDGVGGIPKLQRDVLTFERWGSTETVEIDGRVVAVQDAATAEDYCSTLETQAANMIDEIGRPVADPFVGGYQTVRTEDGAVVIEDGTICISTAFPIWQVTKLTLGYVGGKIQQQGGDITPYVYERTEYDLLSDFTRGGLSESKAYALYYTKGAPGINGLSFIPRTFSGDMGWMQYNAIEYILQAKFGIKPRLTSADIVNLMFRVEYIPYISTRVRQHKTATNGIEAAMSYGQGGAVISARTYGGHLRARAQMLGLPEKSMQVVFSPSASLPVPGQRIDSTNYIGSVVTEYYPTYRKSQIAMSPNYNRINRFVDIKKDLRQFEIPMEGSTDRNVIHEDYIVIGEREGKFPTMMSDAMQSATMTALMGGGTNVEINAAVLTTSNKADKTDGAQVILPLVKTAVGNSVLFYAKYKNNYSAGTVSDDSPRVGESSRLQKDVRYTDAYGNAKYLHMDLMTGASIRAGDIQTAHSIPLTGGVELGRSVISTADKPILLNKDARESVALTYQIHYVSNTDIIIGQEMAARAPWLAYKDYSAPMVYTYHSPINPLTGEATEADRGGKEISTGTHLNVRYVQMPTVGDHVAWAVKQDGVFLFGANSKMPDRVYFNFRDKLAEVAGGAVEETIENVFVTLNTSNVSFVNTADYTTKGGTYTNNFKARDSYVLPKNITVKMGGANITNYTWNRTTGALEVPNVTDDLEITVFGENNAHTVIVEFEFWDQYGNDLLYTEKSYGVYPYGFKVVVPNIIEHAHDGEMRAFSSGKETYTVAITQDVTIYESYYLKVIE